MLRCRGETALSRFSFSIYSPRLGSILATWTPRDTRITTPRVSTHTKLIVFLWFQRPPDCRNQPIRCVASTQDRLRDPNSPIDFPRVSLSLELTVASHGVRWTVYRYVTISLCTTTGRTVSMTIGDRHSILATTSASFWLRAGPCSACWPALPEEQPSCPSLNYQPTTRFPSRRVAFARSLTKLEHRTTKEHGATTGLVVKQRELGILVDDEEREHDGTDVNE